MAFKYGTGMVLGKSQTWINQSSTRKFFFVRYDTFIRIHLILMRIRIRILNPHWKKWIQVISLKFTDF